MELNSDPTTDEFGVIGGGIVAVLAAFLPWMRVGVEAGPVDASSAAAGIEGLGLLTLLFGLVAAALVLVDIIDVGALAAAAVGVAIAVVAVFKLVDLEGLAAAGIGLYLTILAGIVVAIAGGYAATSDTDERGAKLG